MNQKIKTLKTIHFAICAGIIVAYLFVGEFSVEKLKNYSLNNEELIYALIPIVAIVVSTILFKNQLKQIDPKLTIEEKTPFYQSASIVRWAILEGAAFVVLFVDTHLPIFGIIAILYLVFLSPTENKMNNDLQNTIR
jgi:hypothetical protein